MTSKQGERQQLHTDDFSMAYYMASCCRDKLISLSFQAMVQEAPAAAHPMWITSLGTLNSSGAQGFRSPPSSLIATQKPSIMWMCTCSHRLQSAWLSTMTSCSGSGANQLRHHVAKQTQHSKEEATHRVDPAAA